MQPTCLKRPRSRPPAAESKASAFGRRQPAHCWALMIGVLLLLGGPTAKAADVVPSEQQVKAAFLLNFAKYVDWPAQAFAATNSPFVVGVMGESRLDGELQKMVEGKSVNGRPMVLKHVMEDADLASCQILFICINHQNRVAETVVKLKNASVLTVGEDDEFLDNGGMINLATRGRKVRLEISLAPARQAGLTISSKLLSTAELVKGK
jgi:hypothetical protein